MASTPELALFGDAGQTVRALIDEWRRRGNPPREVRGASPTFGEKLPANRIVVTDSGRTLGTLPSLVDAQDAYSWLVGRGYGSVGLGLGMRSERPRRTVTGRSRCSAATGGS